MNSQNNNENSNNTDTADKDIYSNSNNQPSQTGESAASDDEKGNVQYADRSIRDDINDYNRIKATVIINTITIIIQAKKIPMMYYWYKAHALQKAVQIK